MKKKTVKKQLMGICKFDRDSAERLQRFVRSRGRENYDSFLLAAAIYRKLGIGDNSNVNCIRLSENLDEATITIRMPEGKI